MYHRCQSVILEFNRATKANSYSILTLNLTFAFWKEANYIIPTLSLVDKPIVRVGMNLDIIHFGR